ncbi:ABC transporter permease [Tahibacter amnicola]|uniref:Transport permease protein n=1 Tax=Tahibacter amnicola TaxID=2976241 RepID=A0ABY6B7H5_9GAMM|nr:ABC transporter permease [Tahibacter amnicola]UXI66051.1 ABC transporter permease [Tahibacter amnicola]
MIRRVLGLLRKEVVQLLRDPVVLFIVLFLYTVEAVTCTRALTFEVRHLPFGVVDQDRSVASRRLIELFDLSEAFDLTRQSDTPTAVGEWLDRNTVGMVLVIPPGFERDHRAGMRPALQLLLDGTYSNTAESALHYAHALAARFDAEQPPLLVPTGSAHAMAIPRVWYNPDQSTKTFMVLSMIALAGMMVGAMVPAASIVREKERGTIEQLMVTPIRTGELFFAKTVPTVALNVLALFPALIIVALFQVPFRGSLATLLVMAAVFQLSAVAFGVLVASVTRSTQQALLLAFFGLFPIMFLSGTVTPIESMPPLLQRLSLLSPLRYYMEIMQGIFLKGTGWHELWPQAMALLAVGSSLFAMAAAIFRRRMV